MDSVGAAAVVRRVPGVTGSVSRVLAERGVGGYRQYRIPAMVVTGTGRIIVVYDARPDVDDLPSPIDLVVRTSDDNGESWSGQRIVRTSQGYTGFGDASLTVDADTGRVLLFHEVTELAGFFESVPGTADDDPRVQHVELGHSDDDGDSWVFRRVTGQLKRGGIDGLFAASGHGAQLFAGPYAGRLLQPCVVRQNRQISAAVAYSDDHGETWTLGQIVGRGTNESKAVALVDGTILVNSRATPRRMVARSTDGGASFAPPYADAALADPSDNGDAVRFDGRPVLNSFHGEDRSLLCSHNDDADLRRNLVVRYSPDDGGRWTRHCVIYSGSAGYSVLSRLANGRIGVCYEREGYSQIVFCSIDPSDLLDDPDHEGGGCGNDDQSLARGDDALEFDMIMRFIRPARPGRVPETVRGHPLPLDDAQSWSPAEWREIGQAGTTDQVQMLYTREDLPELRGPVRPGLAAGDEMRFAGRIRNRGPEPAIGVTLSGTFAEPRATEPLNLGAGQAACYRVVRYFVTASDVAEGSVSVRFTAAATVGGLPVSREIIRRYSVTTGRAE